MAAATGSHSGGGNLRGRALPYAVALLTTALWSSSYVLIKWGLEDIPPLYFATLRYALAFVVLLAADMAFSRNGRGGGSWSRKSGGLLVVAGVGGYTVAQGLQYVGLYYLPAVTTSLLLNFNPFFVLLLGVGLLGEGVSSGQLAGFGLAVLGAFVFFSEEVAWGGQVFGVVVVLVSGVGWAVYVVSIRFFHGTGSMSPLRLTTVTMGVGVLGMVALTAASGEYSPLTPDGVITVVWLATANTALAFFLWNWSLRAIPPYELTVLQDLMLVEIALLASFFLGEAITPVMVVGMALVIGGVLVVQSRGGGGRRRAGQAEAKGGEAPEGEARAPPRPVLPLRPPGVQPPEEVPLGDD